MTPHASIYGAAELYDLAFSYRDFGAQSHFLRTLFKNKRAREALSFLELAAGPAHHCIDMLANGLQASGLDSSPQMAEYARKKAFERGLSLPYQVADMVRFKTSQKFDLAACLLCSASYLLKDADVTSHFQCVRAALNDGGMYVLELTHPAELSGTPKSKHSWNMRDAQGELHIDWDGDPARAVAGVWRTDVRLRYQPFDGSASMVVSDSANQRGFGYAEISSLAEPCGFLVAACYGAFDEQVPLDSPRAQRMILALHAV